MVERFISADCPECWSGNEAAAASAPAWRFDWVTPTPSGVEAPLSAAALVESAERALRAGGPAPAAPPPAVPPPASAHRPAARAAKSPGLALAVGPAWHGYFGVQADVQGALPLGSSLWLALIEAIPAGAEGNPVKRELVRSVAGPLTLALPRGKAGIQHLQAMRWPDSAKPERLQARGWIESADGTILAVASPRCPLQ